MVFGYGYVTDLMEHPQMRDEIAVAHLEFGLEILKGQLGLVARRVMMESRPFSWIVLSSLSKSSIGSRFQLGSPARPCA